jgi:hypothetical protein
MGALKFIRNPLLMSLNAQMTVVLGQIFVPLQPLFPQVGIHLVCDPPKADSSGLVAFINIFLAAPSLIDKRVGH